MIAKNNPYTLLGIYFLAVLVILGVTEVTGLAARIQGFSRSVSAPVQVRAQQVVQHIHRPIVALLNDWHNSITMADLVAENATLHAQLAGFEQLQKENTELRAQIGMQPKVLAQQLVSVPILSFPYRLISIGSQSGAHPGSLVLVKGTLVGRVLDVAADYSRVVLLSDPEAVALIGITNLGQRGLVRGIDHQLVLTEVPQDASINTGDRVMTAGEKGIKPGIYIGTIGQEKTVKTDAVKTFVIEQVLSFDTASLVEIQ